MQTFPAQLRWSTTTDAGYVNLPSSTPIPQAGERVTFRLRGVERTAIVLSSIHASSRWNIVVRLPDLE